MIALTPQGLVIETQEEIAAGLRSSIAGVLSIPVEALEDKSLVGHLISIFSERLALLCQFGQAVNASADPDAAVDESLVQVSAITGTEPRLPTPSTVIETLTGSPGTVVPIRTKFAVEVTGKEFQTIGAITLVAATAWAGSTGYSQGDRVTNASRVYQALFDGVSAASGGPTTDLPVVVDGSVSWRYIGEGTAVIDTPIESVELDAILGLANTINEIVTAVGGLQSVRNLLDADLGRSKESNESLRIRRGQETAGKGTSPPDAIRARLLRLPGVIAASVFKNSTDYYDAFGLPPHSVEALVRGGVDQDIRDTLWACVSGGIPTFGSIAGTIIDSEGTVQDIFHTRPTEIPVYISVALQKDRRVYPGSAAVVRAIIDYGDNQESGRDVVPSAISGQAFKVQGVLNVTDVRVGFSPSPAGTAVLPMSLRQLALYDSSRIIVIATDGTP